jgi:phage terminase small subunit
MPQEPGPLPVLSAKHQAFVEQYLIDFNGAAAAIRAGYSALAAKEIGSRLLTREDVRAVVEAEKARMATRAAVSKENVLATLKAIAFADYTKAFTDGWRLASPEEIPEDLRLCISEIIPLKDGTIRVKFADRSRALELLAKHLGLFEAAEKGPGFTLVINQANMLNAGVDGPTDRVEMGGFTIDIPRDG